jgi:HAD superfamily phosphoserine phosphatase-like hydrolase
MNSALQLTNSRDSGVAKDTKALQTGIAVFDVCGTLYRANTTYDFIEYYLRGRSWLKYKTLRICRLRMFIPLWYAVKILAKCDALRLFGVRLLSGRHIEDVRAAAVDFVVSVLASKKNECTMALLLSLRQQGYEIVLASASISFVVEAIAAVLNVKTALACQLETSGSFLTGRYAHDVCGRKHDAVARAFPSYKELAVITDNREDVPLLRLASKRWVVCSQKKRRRWNDVLARVEFIEC